MINLFTKVGQRIFELGQDDFFAYPDATWDMKHKEEYWTGQQIAVIRGQVNPNDFIKLQLWARVVKDQGGTTTAIIPQLPAAQGDRGVTTPGSIYAEMINAAKLGKLIATDVHSPAAAGFYDNLIEVPSTVVADLLPQDHYDAVIAPDKGAQIRAHAFADELFCDVLYAEKSRDFDSGKLTGFVTPEDYDYNGKYLLVDDICVGGGTFMGLADKMSEQGFDGELDLYVTHGVFSNGTQELEKYFNNIYTTDSRTSVYRTDRVKTLKIVERLFAYV